MENSSLKGRILMEMENLISQSCNEHNVVEEFKELHIALLKKHYNAARVSIDYHRRRIKMDIVTDDSCYDPKKVNISIPTLYVNLFFRNLNDFLKSCIQKDNKSLGFYAGLIRSFTNREVLLTAI